MVRMNSMRVVIAKAHENLFDGEANSVTIPTTAGEVTILPHHEPLVSIVKAGTISVRIGEERKTFNVRDGIVEVSGNHAIVLL